MHERGESYTYQSRHITNIFGVVTWRFLWEYDVVRILTRTVLDLAVILFKLPYSFLKGILCISKVWTTFWKGTFFNKPKTEVLFCPFKNVYPCTWIEGRLSWLGVMVCWIALCTFSSRLGIIRLWTFIQGIFRSLLNLWVRNDLFVWIRDLLGPSSMMSRWTLKVIRTSSMLG